MNIFKKIGAAFKKLLSKTLFDKTFWRFVLVGVVNTLVTIVVFFLLRHLSVQEDISYYTIAYGEDRAISDGDAVMEYLN